MAHPFLKLKRSILLVMYSWIKAFYHVMNHKYSITLAVTRTCFVTKAMPISYIDSKCHIKKMKRSRTCLIGYSDFISHEWIFIVWGATHTQTLTSQTKETRRMPAGFKMGVLLKHSNKTYTGCPPKIFWALIHQSSVLYISV